MDDVEDAFEVLEILSYLVCQETWFATMNCEMIKGKEYYTLYVTYDESSVMGRPGSLYVVTFQQVISFE